MREIIQALRSGNKEIRALLAEADEGINRVILAHFLTHGSELETEFSVFQQVRTQLLWLFAQEEKGLIVRHLQEEPISEDDLRPIRELQAEISGLLETLKAAANDYTAPADGCPTYDTLTNNLAAMHALFTARMPIAEDLYTHITGGKQ